jgi:DNA repair exonuclease SbcCD nuclease subunit
MVTRDSDATADRPPSEMISVILRVKIVSVCRICVFLLTYFLPLLPYSIYISTSICMYILASDNHLGYMEKDPVRGHDSINTFEEILTIARDQKVDFILLGGDLFHENRPSRKILYQTMDLLRAYCFGNRSNPMEILSDPATNFAPSRFLSANYQDPNFQVSIPIFSIHGNHDDPSGVSVLSLSL